MLTHTANDRPSAAETQRKYKQLVEAVKAFEAFLDNSIFERVDEKMLALGIASKPVIRRRRTVRRNRFNLHRNVK